MATAICNDVFLWITNVGCGMTRTVLLGLEPGSRVWMSVDEQPQLFERMSDSKDGRSIRGMKPVKGFGTAWEDIFHANLLAVDLEFIERPVDQGAASIRYGAHPTLNDLKDYGYA